MSTTAEKLAYLSETKAQIRDAIIAKGVDVPESTVFRDYVGKIEEISTGVPLPQLSNPAGPEHIYNGYDAIGQDGSVINGIAMTYDEGYGTGFNEGTESGYADGYNTGYSNGYNEGYTMGYTDCSGGVGPPQPLTYVWDADTLTLTISEV